MIQKDAAYLLFIEDFGNGPLFKNQTELATELINDPESEYFSTRDDITNYNKSLSRLKAYLSQLFSDSARRNVTPEFRHSLQKILSKRNNISTDVEDLVNSIISDLREKNNKLKSDTSQISIKRDNDSYLDFLNKIVNAKYIAFFTAREIRFDYEIRDQKYSLIDFLISDLLVFFRREKLFKYYRFNFPLPQTCQLFWRALRKELTKFFKKNTEVFRILLAISRNNNFLNLEENISVEFSDDNVESYFASKLLEYLSKNNFINVFHLGQPVYLTPFITINPNGGPEQNTYMLLQSSQGEEIIHKFSNEEYIFWKLFVWDNLKGNKQGKLVEYLSSY